MYPLLFCSLLGQNNHAQNVEHALDLASRCAHPEAVWLFHVASTRARTVPELIQCLNNTSRDDVRGAMYSTILRGDFAAFFWTQLRTPFAMAWKAKVACTEHYARENALAIAEAAVELGDRDAFFWLGHVWEKIVPEPDIDRARHFYQKAAELNHALACSRLGRSFGEGDLRQVFWLGKAASLGERDFFLLFLKRQITESASKAVLYAVGRALKNHINVPKREIFGSSLYFDELKSFAVSALMFYHAQTRACRAAVDCWVIIASRFRVVKDVRRLVGRLIWESRDLALFAPQKIEF